MIEKFDKLSYNQGKKFLKFFDALSNKYPPMTFQEYRDADGNHTNWFPARCYQTSASMYREWFTLAVLNNHDFIVRVYKQRDYDATKIFTDIINSVEFHRHIINVNEYDDYCLLLNCVTLSCNERHCVKINYNWDFDICYLIDYYNDKINFNNINELSKYLQFRKAIHNLERPDKWHTEYSLNISGKKKYIIGGSHLRIPGDVKFLHITLDDVDGIYDIQVGLNGIVFYTKNTLSERSNRHDVDFSNSKNSIAMISTLLENIEAILE